MLPSALILITCLAFDLWTDLAAKRDVLTGKWNVSHIRGVIWRMVAAIPMGIIYWPSLFLWLPYWGVFDSVIAAVKRYPYPWVGSTARLDRFQQAHRWAVWVKYILGIIGITLYILL